jgi:hypothetical protein
MPNPDLKKIIHTMQYTMLVELFLNCEDKLRILAAQNAKVFQSSPSLRRIRWRSMSRHILRIPGHVGNFTSGTGRMESCPVAVRLRQ